MRLVPFLLCLSLTLFSEEITVLQTIEGEGDTLFYRATLGTLSVSGPKSRQEMGYIAYVKESFQEKRPLLFAFNGGPGASSVWLHLGAFGPYRLASPDEGQGPTPPYRLLPNRETLLTFADLVFIDPIGTGLSSDDPHFYNFQSDFASVAEFIEAYVTLFDRWDSPKYLAGESYGAMRAVGVAQELQEKRGLFLEGLLLISAALDYQTFLPHPDNLFPYFLSLPTYMATAHYHGRYRPEATLEEVAAEGRQLAYHTYAPYLLCNGCHSPQDKGELFEELSRVTGLSSDLVGLCQGKIDPSLYTTHFFFPFERRLLGAYDTRLVSYASSPSHISFFEDPSVSSMEGIFTGGLHTYLSQTFGVRSPYTILNEELNRSWDYSLPLPWGYPNSADSLRRLLHANPTLRLWVGAGYFDLVTPFAAAEYTLDHLDLADPKRPRPPVHCYEGGHMYYLNPKAREAMYRDLIPFFKPEASR